jgi:hypothetical protein
MKFMKHFKLGASYKSLRTSGLWEEVRILVMIARVEPDAFK